MRLSRPELVRRLKKFRPSSVKQCKEAGIEVKYLNGGAFRNSYLISGHSGLILKLPVGRNRHGHDGKGHTKDEVSAILKISKAPALRPLRRYIPTVVISDPDGNYLLGVKYQKFVGPNPVIDILSDLVSDLGILDHDIQRSNLMVDGHGNIKITDLGLFYF